MPSSAFWKLVGRIQIPDAEALELIDYAGRNGEVRQTPTLPIVVPPDASGCLPLQIEAALAAIGEPAWLMRKNRAAPFSG
jgi:hypothetical protein